MYMITDWTWEVNSSWFFGHLDCICQSLEGRVPMLGRWAGDGGLCDELLPLIETNRGPGPEGSTILARVGAHRPAINRQVVILLVIPFLR
jgi:hypothetical protein